MRACPAAGTSTDPVIANVVCSTEGTVMFMWKCGPASASTHRAIRITPIS